MRTPSSSPLAASGTHSFGTLVLYGSSFDDESKETARSLAAQAAVALENARLHGVVERQALVDGLTGLANRRHCEEELEAELLRAERLGGATALVFADLDDFKAVNDLHGHPAGDAVICAFAELLRESVREIDTPGRFGGEEFVLLLPGTDAAGAAKCRRAGAGRPRRARDRHAGRRGDPHHGELRRRHGAAAARRPQS